MYVGGILMAIAWFRSWMRLLAWSSVLASSLAVSQLVRTSAKREKRLIACGSCKKVGQASCFSHLYLPSLYRPYQTRLKSNAVWAVMASRRVVCRLHRTDSNCIRPRALKKR